MSSHPSVLQGGPLPAARPASRTLREALACLLILVAPGPLGPARAAEAPTPVSADLVRSLAEAMRSANPDLRSLDRTAEAERLNAAAVRRWADPQGQVGGAWYRFTDMRAENGDVYYGLEQPLPLFGKERAARQLAGTVAEAAAVRTEARFAELRRDLALALFDSAAARSTADLVAQDLVWLDAQLRLAHARLASGSDPAAMVLRLENELDRRRLEWTNALAVVRDAQAGLDRLLGPALTNLPPHGLALPPVADPVPFGPVVVRFAEQAEPEVQRRAEDVKVANATVESTRRSARPDVAFGAQAYHDTTSGTPAQGMFTLSVSLPWINRANYRRDLQRDQSRLSAAQLSVEDAKLAVRREVHRLTTTIDSARRETLLVQDSVLPRTRRLQDALEAQWTAGRADLRDLLDVRRQRIDAEASAIRATAAYWMAVSELLLCCGLEDLDTLRELTHANPDSPVIRAKNRK